MALRPQEVTAVVENDPVVRLIEQYTRRVEQLIDDVLRGKSQDGRVQVEVHRMTDRVWTEFKVVVPFAITRRERRIIRGAAKQRHAFPPGLFAAIAQRYEDVGWEQVTINARPATEPARYDIHVRLCAVKTGQPPPSPVVSPGDATTAHAANILPFLRPGETP